MNSPFLFGKVVSGKMFINRTSEISRLTINFHSGINSMLISQRRWGKSSLVKQVSEIMSKEKNIHFCFIDLFGIKNESEFYQLFLKEVLKSSSSKWEEWMQNGKDFLKNIIPVFSFGLNPATDFSVKIEWDQAKKHIDDILTLPERIASEKKIRIIICIDEFQQIGEFSDALLIQQKLRSVWQHHKMTTYCLYGSKRHVVSNMFTAPSMPFYKFGDLIQLGKIDASKWVKHITIAFEKNNKEISEEMAMKIISIVNNHPYYVQQLSHQVYINTLRKTDNSIVDRSVEELLLYNQIMFIRDIEGLSSLQLSLLKAIANNERKITSKEIIKKYQLGTTGNILRLKKALEQKDIIDFYETTPCFIDPLFELWFKKNMNQ